MALLTHWIIVDVCRINHSLFPENRKRKAGNIDKGGPNENSGAEKKMAATRDKSTNPGEVEEKLKRAQRQIARLEKELWEKDRELEKLRYLNMKLQESMVYIQSTPNIYWLHK